MNLWPFLLLGFGIPAAGWFSTLHATPPSAPVVPAETLVFLDFKDHAGQPVTVRQLSLGVRMNGNFHVGQKIFDTDGTLLQEREIDGHLEPAELDQLRSALSTLDVSTTTKDVANIGYSTDLSRGWQGVLSVAREGTNQIVRFTSLRPDTYPERSVNSNRLVTFIFDLKNLALRKIDGENQ